MPRVAQVVVLVGDSVTLSRDLRLRIPSAEPQHAIIMAHDDGTQEGLQSLREMNLKEEERDADVEMDTIPVAESESVKKERSTSVSGDVPTPGTGTPSGVKRQSRSPVKTERMAQSPAVKPSHEETVGGGVTLKLEPGKPPKLSRTTSHKIERRPPPLFFDYEDKTGEATSTFTILPDCNYARKDLGDTEHALECDCAEEWGKLPRTVNGQVGNEDERMYI